MITAEKEFKRESGDVIKIWISLHIGSYGDGIIWGIRISKRAPRKRKFIAITCYDDYRYRGLDLGKERDNYELNFYLNYATTEEINSVKMIIVDKIKDSIF